MNAAGVRRLLYVDDDASSRRLIVRLFRRHRPEEELVTAASVEEARASIAERKPSLVLLDLTLPDGSGEDILRIVKAEGDVPVVILTGQAERATRERMLNAGADAFFAKPFDVKLLLRTIDRLIG